jgi:hypothetical protein
MGIWSKSYSSRDNCQKNTPRFHGEAGWFGELSPMGAGKPLAPARGALLELSLDHGCRGFLAGLLRDLSHAPLEIIGESPVFASVYLQAFLFLSDHDATLSFVFQ